jgi:hypothetical protein
MGELLRFTSQDARDHALGNLSERYGLPAVASLDPIGCQLQLAPDLEMLLCKSAQVLSDSYALLFGTLRLQAIFCHYVFVSPLYAFNMAARGRYAQHPDPECSHDVP